MIPAYMQAPISTTAEAVAFIYALHADDRLFHFDDSPETIVNMHSGARIFSEEECDAVATRVAEMRAIPGFDPFDIACDLI